MLIRILLVLALFFSVGMTYAHDAKIDINTANVDQLAELNGIGQIKAKAIVQYRQEHGKFESLDQLADVKGIGKKLVEINKETLEVTH